MSTTTQTEDNDIATDDKYERGGLRRAAVVERYHQLQEQQRNAQETNDEHAAQDSQTSDHNRGILREIIPPLREVIRPTIIRKSIVDVETHPPLDAEALEENVNNHIEDPIAHRQISSLRFVFADGETSRWYDFESDSELERIIDHYADGDLGRMFRDPVDVARTQTSPKLTYPPQTYTGYVRYGITRRIRAVGKHHVRAQNVENDAPSLSYADRMSLYSTVGFAGAVALSLVLFPVVLLASSSDMAVVTSTIVLLLGVLCHLIAAIVLEAKVDGYGPDTHYQYLFAPIMAVGRWLVRGFKRLNQR